MELLVFGHAGARVVVFPTRGGRFYEYENLRITQWLADKLEKGWLQLYCLDSVDTESFYCWWAHPSGRIARHLAYESYVLEEVFPLMDQLNRHPCTIAHGCSLGAFHAANIALRHPERFQKLAAFSGRFDLTEPVEWFGDLLDGFYNDDVYFNTPLHFLPNLDDLARLEALRRMDIVIVIGEEDPFRAQNERLCRLLWEKGAQPKLHLWQDRAHRGYYWRRMAALYL